MICTAARKSASCSMKSTATPKSVITSARAACTGWAEMTTPTAPTRITAAAAAKTSRSGQVARVAARRGTAWSMGSVAPLGVDAGRHAVRDRLFGLLRTCLRLARLGLRLARLGLRLARLARGPHRLHAGPHGVHLLAVGRRPLLGPPDAALHAAVGQGDVLVEQVGF